MKDFITANGGVNATGTVASGTQGYSVRYIVKNGSVYYIIAAQQTGANSTTVEFSGMQLLDRIIEI